MNRTLTHKNKNVFIVISLVSQKFTTFNLFLTKKLCAVLSLFFYSEQLKSSKLTFRYKGGEIQKVSVNSEPLLGVKRTDV